MEKWVDSPGDILALLGIVSVLVGFLFWVIRSEILNVGKQLKPNGGSTMADQVLSIDARVNTILERQGQIAHSVEQLRADNDEVHTILSHKVDQIGARLNDHASSEAHNRRKED